jgi:outer membrane protein assembly factor BamB
VESLVAGDPWQVGTYRLRARLGSGGMGRVFLGYSPAGRPVAVKVIHPELAKDPMFRTRFRREVAAAKAVSGAYTAPVMAAGPDDDPPWLATAFVPGPSLADAVAAAGPLPEPSVWKLTAGLVEALQAVHAAGLVHRDLKPANVLLANDGPRVIDFGISAAVEGTRMTSTGLVAGTPSFMSPEQANGARVGPESDVFSLGCVIVFAATTAPAFGDGHVASVLYRLVHAEPALGRVPGGLREVVAACLAKAPADRPTLAWLVTAVAGGLGPEAGTGLTSFWPGAVSRLIGEYQDRLSTEIPAPLAGDGGRLVGNAPPQPATVAASQAGMAPSASGPGPLIAGPAGLVTDTGPAPTVGAASASAGSSMAAPPARMPAPGTVRVAPGDVAAAPTAYPELPGDVPPGGPSSGVSRRGLLVALGLTAAAGAAGATWELTRGGNGNRSAGRGSNASLSHKHGPSATPPGAAGPVTPGTKVWAFSTGGSIGSSVVVASDTVYFGSSDDNVYAVNARTGGKVWAYPTNGDVRSGIAVASGSVFAGSYDGHLYALNARSGHRIWAYPANSIAAAGVIAAGGTVYSGALGIVAVALGASNGTKKWDYVQAGSGLHGIAMAGHVLYAGASNDEVYALRGDSGAVIWRFAANGPMSSGIAVADGIVYAGSDDQHLYALNASNGRRAWTFPAGGAVESGIVVAGGIVYFGSGDDNVYALDASNGDLVWKFATESQVQAGIAVVNGRVYVGSSDNNVYALDATHGHKIWAFPTEGPIESGIAVANGVVYFGSIDNNLYAVGV